MGLILVIEECLENNPAGFLILSVLQRWSILPHLELDFCSWDWIGF